MLRLNDTQMIQDYLALDVRLAWQPHSAVEVSLADQNLLADRHLEYTDET